MWLFSICCQIDWFVLFYWIVMHGYNLSSLIQVFYVTTMPVPANTELMVYYGAAYATELGYDPEKQLSVWQVYKNSGESMTVVCSVCLIFILFSLFICYKYEGRLITSKDHVFLIDLWHNY